MTPTTKSLLDRRDAVLGPNMSTFYEDPVHLVKGDGVWLWDADGKKYLDCYNNVPHVGHCHPHVVDAIAKQAATLNTHTRYLHEGILDYTERLTATFDDPLNTALLCCTGSEANDVALRMAEAVTGKTGIIATDHTYHGNTSTVSQLSTTNTPKLGQSNHIRFVPTPDSYRPATNDPAQFFADQVSAKIAELQASEHGFAALILCPFFGNEGFPDLPAGFLDATLKAVHAAGGILIADEVQPGFGRLGSHFWGHQFQGITPDVVTLGKPMGNGHPVAGVVTSADIMHEFRTAFRYFNTFGGNPVSCAAAMAVMDVIESEGLMTRAADVGTYAKDAMQSLANKNEIIGDVRGKGLFLGVELVAERTTREPAAEKMVQAVVGDCMKNAVIIGATNRSLPGRNNTLCYSPALIATKDDIDQIVTQF